MATNHLQEVLYDIHNLGCADAPTLLDIVSILDNDFNPEQLIQLRMHLTAMRKLVSKALKRQLK